MVLRRMLRFICIVTALVAAGCGGGPPRPPQLPDDPTLASATPPSCLREDSQSARAWGEFRADYPFHAQTIALSDTFGDGCRVVVIAEPPPSVSPPRLAALLPAGAPPLTARRHGIGHDGWTTDLTTILPPLSDDQTAALVSSLSRLLFGTSYKAYATAIGAVSPSATDTSIEVSPGDISRALLDRDASLTPVASGNRIPFSAVLAGQADGVYFADAPGLVVWAMPRPASLDSRAAAARVFALDSDLVLGAVASPRGVAILARERATPIDRIAPLRYETMAVLASASGSELDQSYERTNVLAGRFDGVHDWAPIYLSPELVDTELGSLLNLADQELKGWSNAGETTYANFAYPEPLWWPFPRALPSYLSTSTLTYNWNTNGVGAVVETDGASIYWVRDTGSLPVTYLPEDVESAEASKAANAAHAFFSAQEDPFLVRVVQYSALYQVFHAFGVTATPAPTSSVPEAAGATLEGATYEALKRLSETDADGLRAAIERQQAREGVTPPPDADDPSDAAVRVLMEVLALHGKLQGLSDSARDEVLRGVAHALANPDRDLAKLREKMLAGTLTEDERTKVVGFLLAQDFSSYQEAVKAFVPDLDSVRSAFSAAALAGRDPIIRTPTIVVSSNRGSLKEAWGGHNIEAQVPLVRLHGGKGTVISAEGESRVLPGVQSVRDVGLTSDGKVSVIAPRAPRALDAVLKRPVVPDGPASRGFVARAPGSSLQIEKVSDGFVLTRDGEAPFHARNRVELTEAVAAHAARADGNVVLHLQGLGVDESRTLIGSAQLKLRRGIVGISEPSGELQGARLNLASAEITPPSIQTVADGRVLAEFRVTMDTPRRAGAVARLKVSFSRSAVGRTTGRIQEIARLAIRRLKAHFGARAPSPSEATLEMRRDLRRFDPEAGITTEYEHRDMASDFVIGTADVVPAAGEL